MDLSESGKDPLLRAAQAGLVTHVVCVLGDRPDGLAARLTNAELIALDSVAMAFLCERWAGPVVRAAPLLYAVAAEGREADLSREAQRLGRKLVGSDAPGFVRIAPIPVEASPRIEVARIEHQVSAIEAQVREGGAQLAPELQAAASRIEEVVARLSAAQAAAIGDPERRESVARSLAAMRFAVREIAARAEEVRTAAESLRGSSAAGQVALGDKLDRIAEAVAALEARAVARASRDFSPEADSLQRVLVGFRTVLRELSDKVGAAEAGGAGAVALEAKIDRVIDVLAQTGAGGDPAAMADAVAQRLEPRLAHMQDTLLARSRPAPEDLAFGKESFLRLIAGFRVVLRRLSEQADALARIEIAPPPTQVGLDEAALDALARRIAEQVSAAMAEGLALAERRRHDPGAALSTPDGVGFALERIARRVEALHEDLAVRFAALARTGEGPQADQVSERLAAGVQEAKAVLSEFLGIAAALTRGLEREPDLRPAPRRLEPRTLRRPL